MSSLPQYGQRGISSGLKDLARRRRFSRLLFAFRQYHHRAALSKNVSERSQKFPFWRPIRNGEHDVGKCASKLGLKSLPEIDGCPVGVIAKSAAAPCAENEGRVAEGLRDLEYAMNALLQQIAGFRLSDFRRVRRGAGDKA